MATNKRPGNLLHVRGELFMKPLEWTSSSLEASSEETKAVSPASESQCGMDHSIRSHSMQTPLGVGEKVNPPVCAATGTVNHIMCTTASTVNSTGGGKHMCNVPNTGLSHSGVLLPVLQDSFQHDIDMKKKKICDPPLLEMKVLSLSPQHSGSDDLVPSGTVEIPAASKDQHPTPLPMHAADKQSVKKGLQGLLFANSADILLAYLKNIINCRRHYGIYISNKLNPRPVNGVWQYREGHEYVVVHHIDHGKEKNGPGVSVCRDLTSKELFILKRITTLTDRLLGVEFLSLEDKYFLPKIYGVFKGKEEIHIYQEYVPGGTLEMCRWNLLQIREFAEELLSAFSYLHSKDLAHFDVKLTNVMMMNLLKPNSLKVIDFESVRRESYPVRNGGYTIMYLPPWHNRLRALTTYDPVLQTADLWAIACILVCFLMQLGSHSKDSEEDRPRLWSEALEAVQKKCSNQCKKGEMCRDCKNEFLMHLTNHGHKLLSVHLRHEMGFTKVEENMAWDQLRRLLLYLTDTDNVDNMRVDNALNILRGDALKIELGDTT